ncbi:hypothetical protein [Hymenobacter wooponensis]|uniref:Uncharacterized protein n=1 Tax=Hymenobacter wooponensis TaxID=1525360 RepID=A0A4Z0MPK1_9BACT|nr:hypothetical protein [Hymenobacter wooponensis]TGD81186.1 hypothetical protein EU557_06340 [Hymenobacter wooponensis]
MPEQPTSPNQNPAAASESLAASETSVGQGGLTDNQNQDERPNQDANPHNLQTPANTTGQQPFANDRNHEENELQSPSRGEFGRQATQGVTQGGYGNELSRGAETYAGTLNTPGATTGYDGEREQKPAGFHEPMGSRYGAEVDPAIIQENSAVSPGFANDNAAPKGLDSGYSENYGTSSLGGGTQNGTAAAQPDAQQRNQSEDYRPGHPEQGPAGLDTGRGATGPANGDQEAGTSNTGGTRSGYNATGSSAQGSDQKGFGSKGGSYNDEYDSANNSGQPGSPSRGDYDKQDAAQNYGGAAGDRNSQQESPDYGSAPRRAESHDESATPKPE